MRNESRWKAQMMIRAFAYVGALYVMALVPGLNSLYYGHGFGWTALMASLSIAMVMIAFDCIRPNHVASRGKRLKFGLAAILGYLIFSYPLAFVAEIAQTGKYTGVFYWTMTFPLSILIELL